MGLLYLYLTVVGMLGQATNLHRDKTLRSMSKIKDKVHATAGHESPEEEVEM